MIQFSFKFINFSFFFLGVIVIGFDRNATFHFAATSLIGTIRIFHNNWKGDRILAHHYISFFFFEFFGAMST